ncbi:MAG TPA: hypothetical protein PK028_00620 [Bacteroidales bacterium]|jgi:hypothetical protein|nr:hypothetical protein [Bacteroidales bacterium]MDI9573664.1 hypothetical protein [Bacteroidota bacterium]MBP9511006.1 hypothetical protein [Bacteroidales bacterium]MBP9587706.1 hypothetical protein [Bacteroidales bacterium]HNQ58932.1 hypothetical protein [Bacteroidales bacterium]
MFEKLDLLYQNYFPYEQLIVGKQLIKIYSRRHAVGLSFKLVIACRLMPFDKCFYDLSFQLV